jgi:hypothetical protein
MMWEAENRCNLGLFQPKNWGQVCRTAPVSQLCTPGLMWVLLPSSEPPFGEGGYALIPCCFPLRGDTCLTHLSRGGLRGKPEALRRWDRSIPLVTMQATLRDPTKCPKVTVPVFLDSG